MDKEKNMYLDLSKLNIVKSNGSILEILKYEKPFNFPDEVLNGNKQILIKDGRMNYV